MITDDQWWFYFQNGYLRLGRTLSDEGLKRLQQRIDAIMLGEADVDYEKMLMQLDSSTGSYGDVKDHTYGFKGATLNYRKIQDLEHDKVFLEYMQQPIFREICSEVYGSHAAISCFRAMFMNKPANRGTILPWHQDGGDQWRLDRDPLVTIWTALDPATIANGCVQIIPGSHRLGLLSKWGHTITPQQEAQYCPEDKIVFLELEAGESVLLHNWALHRSDVNRTEIPRRAFSVCYMDARTKTPEGNGYPVVFGDEACGSV